MGECERRIGHSLGYGPGQFRRIYGIPHRVEPKQNLPPTGARNLSRRRKHKQVWRPRDCRLLREAAPDSQPAMVEYLESLLREAEGASE